jgi:hypothetical protein
MLSEKNFINSKEKYDELIKKYNDNMVNDDIVFTKQDIHFLDNLLKIKNKISILSSLYSKHIHFYQKLSDELEKLYKLKEEYISFYDNFEITIEMDCSKEEDNKWILIEKIIHEKKELLKENNKQISQLQYDIRLLKTLISETDLYSENKISTICCICMEKEIGFSINPCGHTFCENCCDKIYNNKCFVCRKDVAFTTKLFF